MSLVEALVALAVLALALGGYARSVVAGLRTSDQHAQTNRAMTAARRSIETLQGTPFREVFQRFNERLEDDLEGSPGARFAVEGLQPLPGAVDGMVGEIIFPTVGEGDEQQLREDLDLPILGMPRDLSGDGAPDSEDHAADYELLPVLVRVSWLGRSGPSRVELKTLLADI